MTRRKSIASIAAIAAAAAVPAVAAEEWLTVAHLGTNLNVRCYSVGNLKDMADFVNALKLGCHGVPIFSDYGDDAGRHGLDALLGYVHRARFDGFRVEVLAHWFTNKKPVGQFITPTGVGHIKKNQPEYADAVLSGYRLENFTVQPNSAFHQATVIA